MDLCDKKYEFEKQKSVVIFESLRRTDSYILAIDQKASFTLAAGITFLGIYASFFYGMISSESNKINTLFLVSMAGIILVLWAFWFSKIKAVFSPNVEQSSLQSIVSFASLTGSFDSHNEYYEYFSKLDDPHLLNQDIIENHWIDPVPKSV